MSVEKVESVAMFTLFQQLNELKLAWAFGWQLLEEALVDYNTHFKRYGSFGVLVQPERKNTYLRQ